MDRNTQLLAWAASVIQKEQLEGTYGSLELIFEAGRIVRIQRRDSIVPPEAGMQVSRTGV